MHRLHRGQAQPVIDLSRIMIGEIGRLRLRLFDSFQLHQSPTFTPQHDTHQSTTQCRFCRAEADDFFSS